MHRSVVLAALAGTVGSAAAQVVTGTTVLMETDALGGSTVASVNAPFTNGNGQVGFVAALEDGRRAVWYDNAPIFFSDDALPDDLTGGEGTMGIGNNMEFIYSPSFNGEDAVFGEDGLIAVENVQAPDFTAGFNSTFHSRPTMTDDGTSYWIAGINDGMGGTSSQSRILYQRTQDGTFTGLLRAGDIVDGIEVAPFGGIDFDYGVSDDNANRIFIFNDASMTTSSDGTFVVNGSVIAQEGSANGQGDNWDNFDAVDINNAGNYVFSGDTDGDTALDEFIAVNGTIQLRESDAFLGGVLDGSVDALTINDLDQVAFIWDIETDGSDVETLVFSSDLNDLAGSAMALLAVGDGYDDTGDGVADFTITDFNASAGIGPGLELAEDGFIYVEVDMIPVTGGEEIEAVIRLAVPAPAGAMALAIGGAFAARRRR